MNNSQKKPLALIILDGWGISKNGNGNAISLAKTEFFDQLVNKYPSMVLGASSESVGLPAGVFGNSEVGHLNLGAGRVLYQDLLKINKAIEDKSFFKNKEFLLSVQHIKKTGGSWHLMGLVSDGRVHSSLDHLLALLQFAKKEKIKKVFVHVFLDGRDTARDDGYKFVSILEKEMKQLGLGQIVTISGRFYAMDRDNHWERIVKSYQAMLNLEAPVVLSAKKAIKDSYQKNIFDEEFLPVVIKGAEAINDGDALIFFNYRADRAREISEAIVDNKINPKELGPKKKFKNLYFISFTEYAKNLTSHIAFPSENPKNCLGEIISQAGLKQLRIAETEKYAHVTYFFNGGAEKPFKGEDRILIPSPRVDSYSEKPAMSAKKIASKIKEELDKDYYDFILVNFANADMVGHTGNISAAIAGIEVVDNCLKKIVTDILKRDGTVVITADHGNADDMLNTKTKEIVKEHSLNPVPFIVVSNQLKKDLVTPIVLDKLKASGSLSDVAPTVIKLMNLNKAKEMTGESLI